MDLPDWKAQEFYQDSVKFGRYIDEITSKPLEGENDIFQINDYRYVRIHMTKSEKKHLGVITDVSRDILQKKQMQYENTHDALTGLYKYSYFKQCASKMLQNMNEGENGAIVMLDLDSFKSINDTFGHDTGDRYLQSFAAVMQSMPQEHFLTARRSGDEFCMMIFGCKDKSEVTGFLDRFYESLKEHEIELCKGQSRSVSASCGFAWTINREENLEELLKHADEALYEIKRHTKGCYGEYRSS